MFTAQHGDISACTDKAQDICSVAYDISVPVMFSGTTLGLCISICHLLVHWPSVAMASLIQPCYFSLRKEAVHVGILWRCYQCRCANHSLQYSTHMPVPACLGCVFSAHVYSYMHARECMYVHVWVYMSRSNSYCVVFCTLLLITLPMPTLVSDGTV